MDTTLLLCETALLINSSLLFSASSIFLFLIFDAGTNKMLL